MMSGNAIPKTELRFRITSKSPLGKWMTETSEKQGRSPNSTRFILELEDDFVKSPAISHSNNPVNIGDVRLQHPNLNHEASPNVRRHEDKVPITTSKQQQFQRAVATANSKLGKGSTVTQQQLVDYCQKRKILNNKSVTEINQQPPANPNINNLNDKLHSAKPVVQIISNYNTTAQHVSGKNAVRPDSSNQLNTPQNPAANSTVVKLVAADSIIVKIATKKKVLFNCKVPIETPLQHLKDLILGKVDKCACCASFLYNDKTIKDQDTVKSLGMKDKDIIRIIEV